MTPAASPKAAALSPKALREQVLSAHADQVKVARAFIAAAYRVEVEDNGGRWEDRPHHDGRPHGLDIVRELAADYGRDGRPSTGWVVWARLQWG